MAACDFLIGANYSRSDVLGMTPREVMFAAAVALVREDARTAIALEVAAVAAHDPKQAIKNAEALR